MSIEEEDNSPFATQSVHEDEFTDLPLSQGEEEGEDNGEHANENDILPQAEQNAWGTAESEPVENEQEETTEETAETPKGNTTTQSSITPQTTTPAVGTQAYNPELFSTSAQHTFKDKSAVHIEIIDAGKSREGASRGYIVYTIKCNDQIVRRRYSEFESLRNALMNLFPTLIIPPIPEKHKIIKYAKAPTNAKEDTAIIEHRQRMLTVFLKRCLDITKVRESSVFQNFLDPNTNWSEVLVSPPLSDIPKSILMADPIDPANSSPAHSYLPVPSSSVMYVKETEEDKKFNKVEEHAREYEAVISNGVEKVNKRAVRHFAELGTEFSDAGGAFNAFSLQENGELASLLEKFGQVHDNCILSTQETVKTLNYEFTEPLGESAQFASVVKDIIKFRQQKSMQLDITARTLKHRLNYLKSLHKAELEAQRIQKALEDGEAKTGQINFDRKVAKEQEQQKQAELAAGEPLAPLEPKKSSGSFKIPGISKITTMFKDQPEDPDSLRHGNLQKTKQDINQLKQTYTAAERDLERVTESVSEELLRFHTTKNEDLKKMMLSYASAMLDWSRNNLEFWEEAKAETLKDE